MNDSFLSRWSKRKAQVQSAKPEDAAHKKQELASHIGETEISNSVSTSNALDLKPEQQERLASPGSDPFKGPTMEDVKNLTKESDFSAFVAKDVDPNVQHAAMKTLFSDPHFNVMDGLDIYIDDYSKPDPLPQGMLEKMAQSSMLGLFKSTSEDGSSDELSSQSGVIEDQSVEQVLSLPLQEVKALDSEAQKQIQNSEANSEANSENESIKKLKS